LIKVVQIGCGYWGPNVLRNLISHPKVTVVGVVDVDPSIQSWLNEKYPGVLFKTEFSEDLLDEWEADAVAIATPARTHYLIASTVLSSGRHCLVEKPLTTNSEECEELIRLSRDNGVILMVGHTFLHNSAVLKMKKIIENGELGEIYYVYAQRLNLGKIRHDVDVMWNLAPHDISIILYWLGELPIKVSSRGIDFIQPNISDIAFIEMYFPQGTFASLHMSWLDPHKVRKITLVGSKKMAVYDDTAENKITIYDKGVDREHPEKATLGSFEDFGTFQLRLRAGGVSSPSINFVEPLQIEIAQFIDSIYSGNPPLTDGNNGLQTVRVLEAATQSMKNHGESVGVKMI